MHPSPWLHGAVCALLVAAGTGRLSAQWKQPSGYNSLVTFLDGVGVPDGTGVVAGQIEAFEGANKYLPQPAGAGSGTQYVGKTFTDVTGAGGSISGHAEVVAKNFFGNNRSMCPGIVDVRCWSANDFSDNVLKKNGGRVTSFAPDIANFSFVLTSNANSSVRRMDELVNEASFVALVGTNNDGETNPVPEGFVSCYNTISVGLTSGTHASGSTPVTVDGPGRIKPEIVVEYFATSYATAGASSMTAALYSAATGPLADARRPEVMKAIVLAGATKEEFPSWDKTVSRPLDDEFGAGEMNVLHSYRVLTGGDQAPGMVPRRGWDLLSLGADGSETYTFTIDPVASEGVFSLIATWNRTLEYQGSPFFGTYSPQPLPDVNLEFRDGSGTLLQESTSPIDNVEHIYFQDLAPGTYTLTVVTTQLAADNIALAWRTELTHTPRIVGPANAGATIGLDGLVAGAEYDIERSANLSSWSFRGTVTATGAFMDWTDPAPPAGGQAFYRLKYGAP